MRFELHACHNKMPIYSRQKDIMNNNEYDNDSYVLIIKAY